MTGMGLFHSGFGGTPLEAEVEAINVRLWDEVPGQSPFSWQTGGDNRAPFL